MHFFICNQTTNHIPEAVVQSATRKHSTSSPCSGMTSAAEVFGDEAVVDPAPSSSPGLAA